MDRQIVYAGSIPLDTDLLHIQKHIMASLGALARLVLGRDFVVDGLPCVPDAEPYSVVVGPGSFIAPHVTDATAFGSLGTDPGELMRTALLTSDTVLQLGGPPDADHVLCWLVQAAVTEEDSGPLALPYWNAANPDVPFSGPGNSGQQQATRRTLRVALSVKASGPQVGVGVPPAADAGCFGLYKVTTYFGRASIAGIDIVAMPDAPTLRYPLPVMPPGFTQMSVFDGSGLWQAPAGVRHVRVRLVAGGGGGGGGDSSYSGGGGGGGGYAEALLTVTPGTTYPVEVGGGGLAGTPGGSGGSGGDTSFGGLVYATGGQGGGSANPDSHGGAPGRGTIGLLLLSAGYGADGAVISGVPAGNGGASAFGGGGRGSSQGGIPAFAQAKGAGGGGGYSALAFGGGGASGLVVVEY